jgi:hypothetical protein
MHGHHTFFINFCAIYSVFGLSPFVFHGWLLDALVTFQARSFVGGPMYCNDACWHAEVLVWRGPAGKAGDATIVLGALQLNDTECPKVSALLRARCAVMDFPFGTCPKCVVLCQRDGSVSFQDRREPSLLWQPALQGARKNMSNMAEGCRRFVADMKCGDDPTRIVDGETWGCPTSNL